MTSITNPNQVILVTSRYKSKESIITLCWHMRTSFNPELFAISIGKKRFSLALFYYCPSAIYYSQQLAESPASMLTFNWQFATAMTVMLS